MKAPVSHVANAIAAWGDEMPDWVRVLAERGDKAGLARTSSQVGYSVSTLSYVINGRYKAPTAKIELRVRATLMAATIPCPELGDLRLAQCLEWRERAEDFKATSSLRTRMLNACRQCPHNIEKGA
jgi:hypothetical protein